MEKRLRRFWLLTVVLLAAILNIHAAQWTISVTPSGTQGGYVETADGRAQSDVSYSTTWPAAGYVPVFYIHFPKGTFQVTSQNVEALRVNVRDASTGADVATGQPARQFSFVSAEEGWYRFQLTGGTPGVTVLQDFTVTSADATGNNTNVFLAAWRSVPSLHLNTFGSSHQDLPSGNAFDWIYDEVMMPADADYYGTYVESFGFNNGYIGIQNNGSNGGEDGRTVIFSSWDNGDTDSDPSLADFRRSGIVATGEADQVTAERFGGEGTGCHIMLNGKLWKPGRWIRFLLNTRPEQITLSDGSTYNNTLLSAWYWAEGVDTEWHYIGTMRQAGTTNYFGSGFNAFLEEYTRGNISQGCAPHKAYYRRIFTRSMQSGTWYNRNQFSWGHTDGGSADGARNDRLQTALDDFQGEPAIMMQAGGYGDATEGPSNLPYVQPLGIVPDDATLQQLLTDYVEPAIQRQDEERMALAMQSAYTQLDQTEWTISGFSSEETVGEGASNGRATHAIDGDASTFWHTSWWSSGNLNYPHYLSLLHDGVVTIDKIRINIPEGRGANYRAKTVQVQTSANGTDWTAVGTFSLPNASVQEVDLDGYGLQTEHLRLYFTEGYGQYVLIDELEFFQKDEAADLQQLRALAQGYLDRVDTFNGYPSEDLTGLQAVANNAASTADDYRDALASLAAEGHLLKYGEVTEVAHLSAEKAYYLSNASGYGAMMGDGEAVTLRNAAPVEGSGHYADCQPTYKAKARVQDEACNWMLLTADEFPGSYYIYNIGAQKFLNPQYHSNLGDTPQPFGIVRKNGAFVLTAQDYNYGGHTQLCLAPQFQSDPVSVWNNDAGNYFLIYDNYALKPSAELVGRLRHQILMLNKGDVNQDGFITIADVTALVNIILGKASSSTENVNNVADVNDDDAITIADVTALVNIILGK